MLTAKQARAEGEKYFLANLEIEQIDSILDSIENAVSHGKKYIYVYIDVDNKTIIKKFFRKQGYSISCWNSNNQYCISWEQSYFSKFKEYIKKLMKPGGVW